MKLVTSLLFLTLHRVTSYSAKVTKHSSLRMSTFTNPLLTDWSKNPHGLPTFEEIHASHFEPAFDFACKAHLEEIEAIVKNNESPSFQCCVALDRAGAIFRKVGQVYYNLCSSCCPPELQDVQRKLAGPLAEHKSRVSMYPGLFERIDSVQREMLKGGMDLSCEQTQLVNRLHLDLVRSGAKFDTATKQEYAAIVKELAELQTLFSQNILTDENDVTIEISSENLKGLPDFLVEAAEQAAKERGKSGYLITLSRSLVVPFLTYSEDRELRKIVWQKWTSRGELHPSRDNLAVAERILKLRTRQAKMHGFDSYGDYATADTMAGTPARVSELLERVWAPAKLSADREREALESFVREKNLAEGDNSSITIEPWDWRFYAEKVRAAKFNFDDGEVKPYMSLDRMVEAVFDCAYRLYGITFHPLENVKTYHPDVKVYEVREEVDGNEKIVGCFLHDNFARPFKQSGAWMSEYRSQSRNTPEGGDVLPIIVNNNNFAKSSGPTLLSFDDAKTLFHEFGHGLHGLLSNVTYNRLAGTSVLRDFVELPSQLMEHWLSEPEVLKKHARHYITGEPIPDHLLLKMETARKYGTGFDTVEYTASALVDQAIHKLSVDDAGLDISAFEREELSRLKMPQGIPMRHRPAHFQHLFSSSSYAAAYYVYLWAEVLDAEAFQAFKETGNIFDQDTAKRCRKFIYSSGNSISPQEAFRHFRGRDPDVQPMLLKKGLL